RDKARHAVSARHRALPEGLVVSGSAHRAACLGASQAGATQHPLRTAGGQRISSQHA
ncbi:lactoylglutathione lyase, partial [Xanthomonas perforans]